MFVPKITYDKYMGEPLSKLNAEDVSQESEPTIDFGDIDFESLGKPSEVDFESDKPTISELPKEDSIPPDAELTLPDTNYPHELLYRDKRRQRIQSLSIDLKGMSKDINRAVLLPKSIGFSANKLTKLKTEIDGIELQAIENRLPQDRYKKYVSMVNDYNEGIKEHNLLISEHTALTQSKIDKYNEKIKELDYLQSIGDPISTIASKSEPEDIYEGLIKPTAKALVKVPASIIASMALLPGAGIASLIELLPSISADSDKLIEFGTLDDAMNTYKQVMSIPGKLITTPAEQKAVENISLVMKPIEMAGEGWREIGKAINSGLVQLGLEPTYLEPLLATYGEACAIFALPGVIRKLKNSTTFRRLNIRERGLVTEELAKMYRDGMSEADLLRFLGPESSLWAAALARRSIKANYVDLKKYAEVKSREAKIESAVKIKNEEPPKPQGVARPEDVTPSHTFTSKKGNYYYKVDGEWYDSKGKEVVNRFIIRAAEAEKVSPDVEKAIAEDLSTIKAIEDRYGKDIEQVSDKEVEEFFVEREEGVVEKKVATEKAEKVEVPKTVKPAPKVGGGKPPIKDLVVANIGADGKIYYGELGEVHFDLYNRYPNIEWVKEGFTDSSGKYLSKVEALKKVDVSISKEFEEFVKDGELEAITYLEAKAKAEGMVEKKVAPKKVEVVKESIKEIKSQIDINKIKLYRIDDIAPDSTKPHGVYYNIEYKGFKSPHKADFPKGKEYRKTIRPKNPLLVEEVEKTDSAGIHALYKILGDKETNRLKEKGEIGEFIDTMRGTIKGKKELLSELSKKYPETEWNRYYDSREMLEGLAGIIVREKGYDAIIQIDEQFPEMSEYVDLATTKPQLPIKGETEIDWFGEGEPGIKIEEAAEAKPHEPVDLYERFREDPEITKRNLEMLPEYDKIDTPEILLSRISSEINSWADGEKVDIDVTLNLLSQLVEHSKLWAGGTEVPPGIFEGMTSVELQNFSEYLGKLDNWAKSVEPLRLIKKQREEVPVVKEGMEDLYSWYVTARQRRGKLTQKEIETSYVFKSGKRSIDEIVEYLRTKNIEVVKEGVELYSGIDPTKISDVIKKIRRVTPEIISEYEEPSMLKYHPETAREIKAKKAKEKRVAIREPKTFEDFGPLDGKKIEFIHHIKHKYSKTLKQAKDIADAFYEGELDAEGVKVMLAKEVEGIRLYSGIPLDAATKLINKLTNRLKRKVPEKPPEPFPKVKEEAMETVRERRGKLNLANYETNKFANSIEQRTTPKQREVFIFALEKTNVPKEFNRPDLQKVLDKHKKHIETISKEIKIWFDEGWKKIKYHIPDLSVKQIEDYVTHLWDIPKHKKAEAAAWFSTQNRLLERRFIPTYAEGIKRGYKPRTLDILEIIKAHDSICNRAIENIKYIKRLMAMEKEGIPLMQRSKDAPLDWIEVDYPAITRRIPLPKKEVEKKGEFVKEIKVRVHPDLVRPLKAIFEERFDHPVVSAYEAINGVMKQSMLALSLFHHGALFEVGIAAGVLPKILNLYFNPVKIYKGLVRGELDIFTKEAIARDAVYEGLVQFGATADIPINKIQGYLNDLVRMTDDTIMLNRLTKFTSGFYSVWNKALWTYLHDSIKLYAYESLVSKLDPHMDMEMTRKSKREIGQFVNDTAGGQNWDTLMITPKEVQMLTWSLLSADWTVSTTRQALALTGIGRVYKETAGLRRKEGWKFWLRAALFFGVGMNMLNAMFRGKDMKENPQYYEDKEYSYFDKTMFGNTIGKKTYLFKGRYNDGSERYIRWGKQFRDFFELLITPFRKLGGKMAPVPQLMSEIFAGHTLSGFKNDDIYGTKGLEKAKGIFKTIVKAPLPISVKRAMKENMEFKALDIVMQSSKGMSRYAAMEYFKKAVIEGDEDLLSDTYIGTLRNNLPAFTLFNAALSWVEAEIVTDIAKDVEGIEDARSKLNTAVSAYGKRRYGRILRRMEKERADKEVGLKLLRVAIVKARSYRELGLGEKTPSFPTGRGQSSQGSGLGEIRFE